MLEQAARRADEQELDSRMEKQILVAGVGNAWLGDDGFGGAVIRGLEQRELPSGVKVKDFGSGGLDLAYEVMRGYHALVLIDVSKQGGEPGTLYVIEPDPDEIAGGDRGRRGAQPPRHGPGHGPALRQGGARLAGQGRRRRLRAGRRRGDRDGADARGRRRRSRTRSTWCWRSSPAPVRRGLPRRGQLMHELSLSSAIIDTVLRHAEGRRVSSDRDERSAACARSSPTRSPSTSRSSPATRSPRARSWSCELIDGLMRCSSCANEWDPAPPPAEEEEQVMVLPAVPLPGVPGARRRGAAGRGVRGGVHNRR